MAKTAIPAEAPEVRPVGTHVHGGSGWWAMFHTRSKDTSL